MRAIFATALIWSLRMCFGELHIDICPTENFEGKAVDLLIFSGSDVVTNPHDNSGNSFGFIADHTLYTISQSTMVQMISESASWSHIPVVSDVDAELWIGDPRNSRVELRIQNTDYQDVRVPIISMFQGSILESPFLGFSAAVGEKFMMELFEGDVVSWSGTMILEEDLKNNVPYEDKFFCRPCPRNQPIDCRISSLSRDGH